MCVAEVNWGEFTLHVTEEKPYSKEEIYPSSMKNHRIAESQNGRGWKGPPGII